jgi:Ca2+-binding RTX toxin-like protein
MATVTFSEDFTPDKLAYELSRMQEAGVTVTDQIGDGADNITLSNEFGDSMVLSGELGVDAEGEIHGILEKIAIAQSSIVLVTVTDFGNIDVHETLDSLSKALDPGVDGPPKLEDLLELLGSNSIQAAGTDGNDDLQGNDGDNTLNGRHGDDKMHGGNGHDVFHGDQGDDLFDGGKGHDTADYSSESGLGGVTANLMRHKGSDTFGDTDHYKGIEDISGSQQDDALTGDNKSNNIDGNDGEDHIAGLQGSDTIHGGNEDDTLSGGQGKDDLFGDDGNDDLNGGDGNDDIDGGAGDDILVGGNGKDVLKGGAGDDTLTGGRGSDTFFFTDLTGGPDTITDFKFHLDKIAIDFVPDGPETLDASHFFLSGDASGPAPGQEALIYDKATGVLSYDSNVGDATDPVEVAHLKPNTELTKDDFVFLS